MHAGVIYFQKHLSSIMLILLVLKFITSIYIAMRSVSGISILSIEDNTFLNNRPIIGKYLFMYFIHNLNILTLYIRKEYIRKDNNGGFQQFYKIFVCCYEIYNNQCQWFLICGL